MFEKNSILNATNKNKLTNHERFWRSLKKIERETFEARLQPETCYWAIKKLGKFVRDNLLQKRDRGKQDPKRILLILTYRRFVPNFTAVVLKNWNIPQTNKNLWELFQKHPMTWPLGATTIWEK